MMSLISVVFADETVKDDASDGHQNVEKAKKKILQKCWSCAFDFKATGDNCLLLAA